MTRVQRLICVWAIVGFTVGAGLTPATSMDSGKMLAGMLIGASLGAALELRLRLRRGGRA
jgi:membrane associated rhomboid family serine protease